jgi:hypothetical protein
MICPSRFNEVPIFHLLYIITGRAEEVAAFMIPIIFLHTYNSSTLMMILCPRALVATLSLESFSVNHAF